MAKRPVPTIASGFNSVDQLNDTLQDIADAFENTVSRDGTTPNSMAADLDMDGYKLLNVGAGESRGDAVNYGQMLDYVDGRASGYVLQRIELQTAEAAQTVFTLSDFTYEVGANNLAVFVDGVRQFDHTETNSSTVTLGSACAGGESVAFVCNEYLGTIDYEEGVSVSWDDITGPPSYATRWPTWSEVTDKPTTFTPASHNHAASEITTGRLADGRRGVWVQETEPTAATTGELWFW